MASYCRQSGKDRIIFASKEDHETPSNIMVSPDDPEDREPGLILPNGDINWACPCLGGMATGPCGLEFRGAFSCFHYSQAEPKGADCLKEFGGMQKCMQQYPELYGDDDKGMEIEEEMERETKKADSERKELAAPPETAELTAASSSTAAASAATATFQS